MVLDTTKKEKELIQKGFIRDNQPSKRNRFNWWRKEKGTKGSKETRKTTFDLVPYREIVGAGNYIRLEEGFLDILELEGYNLGGMSDSEIREIIYYYESLVKLYVLPIKVVTIYTPLDTSRQQRYYLNLAAKTTNPEHKYLLHRAYTEMKWFGENNYNKEFYVFLYADTVEELREARQDFIRYSGNLHFHDVTYKKKRDLFFRLNNPTSAIFQQ